MGAALIHPSLQPISQYVTTTDASLELIQNDYGRFTTVHFLVVVSLPYRIKQGRGWQSESNGKRVALRQ